MPIDREILSRIDIEAAVELELTTANRLLPRRIDRTALATEASAVASLLRNQYAKDKYGDAAEVVFVDKSRRGRRPISELTLADRVLYRALVDLIAASLPGHLTKRPPIDEFRTSPLTVEGVEYVSKTDVTSFYEFIDHERLANELEAQTGEGPAVDALMELLERVMGRRLGIPQVYRPSDILGDTYIDPIRRRMRRAGFQVTTYSDDFRIASQSLADARRALEMCAREARALGLALNESKTLTFRTEKYRHSLTEFADAEKALFDDEDELERFLWSDFYPDDNSSESAQSLSAVIAQASVFEDDVIEDTKTATETAVDDLDVSLVRAAKKAWGFWIQERGDEEASTVRAGAIAESLLGRALPILGATGYLEPVGRLSEVLRSEPALTPQVAHYLAALGQVDREARARVRTELDDLAAEPSFSSWQQMWLAWAAGQIRPVRIPPAHYSWLIQCVSDPDPALAAAACAALGQLRFGNVEVLASALDRIGPAWRGLVVVGLALSDASVAIEATDTKTDRMIIDGVAGDAASSAQ